MWAIVVICVGLNGNLIANEYESNQPSKKECESVAKYVLESLNQEKIKINSIKCEFISYE